MNKCPACTQRTVPTYEGFQVWCTNCGRLYWLNPDGSVRATQVPIVIAKHEVCHDLHGRVGPREFADGCAAEQRRLFGCAPDADAVRLLEEKINRMEGDAVSQSGTEETW